ncbi:MAG: DUF488 domain-containing protein [Cyclobacteriaceae bacterium]|nr:DUF488 domain-containing protein [Cyclobacteriaceae bacterium]
MHTLKIKRIYEEPFPEDGYRMLVDRLWPRGLKKEEAFIDEWNRNIAPSPELRKWFGHKPENFKRFSGLYADELKAKTDELKRMKSILKNRNLTLLYAAKDTQINHATVLREVLLMVK